MGTVLRTDYVAVNALGVKLYSFNDLAKGRAWVRQNAALHIGLHLQEIALVARKVYRPPSPRFRAGDFAVPPMPAGGVA